MLVELFTIHKGKIVGVSIGLLLGLLILMVGFWKTMFILLCMVIGYWIGNMFDKKEKFLSFLDKILLKITDMRHQ